MQGDTCRHCKQNATCFKQTGVRRRILGSSCYPAFYRGHERIGSDTYWHMMRLRKIWAEGSFSVLKREHCLSKIRKRGIPAVTEECLLSAMALNLKRMVRAILLTSHMLKIGAESLHFLLRFLFCQQVPYLTLSPDAARLGSVIGWRQPFCGPCFRTKTRLQPVCNAYKRQAGFWLDDNLPGNGSSPSSPC